MKKIILTVLVFIPAIVIGWVLFSSNYQTSEEKEFYNSMAKVLSESETVKLSEITDFEWDTVTIVIQPDNSFSESRSYDIIEKMNVNYSIWNDLVLPRYIREYESLFIFFKSNSVEKIFRLNKRSLEIDGITYGFRWATEGDNNLMMIKMLPKDKKRFGTITFCKNEDIKKCQEI